MNRKLKGIVPILCTGLFVFSGCAKQQSVKVDPAIAPSATTTSASSSVTPQAAVSSGSGAAASVAAPATFKESSIAAQSASLAKEYAKGSAGAEKELEKIYFNFDSAALGDDARKTLAENYEKLKGNPRAKLKIEGHCDERGSDEYNLALSERRAQAAVQYLSSLGISEDRLSAIGYGEEKPADAGHTEDAWAKNRRDEFNIIK